MGGSEKPTRIVGRVAEQALLRQAVDGAAGGRPSAIFVHGESGAGKTALVRGACSAARQEGHTVLWGQCVRFGAASSPFQPVLSALQRWRDEGADDRDRTTLLDLDDLSSSASSQAPGTASRMLLRIERLVAELTRRHPTVLVIDDAQWADVTSLDLVAMLVAGFGTQQLAVLVTYRDTDLPAGHPLHEWLADLRRLPGVTDLPLPPLSPDDVEEVIIGHGLADPAASLVDSVHRRSGGNAYLAELLVSDLPPGATELPVGLPPALRDVLLARWHRLSPSARELMSVLAIGGRPFGEDDLREVAATLSVPPAEVGPALAEAAAHAVVEADQRGRYWFHHPMLAEVLGGVVPPGRAAKLHAAFAERMEQRVAGDEDRSRPGDLAQHHEQAGNHDLAFGYLMRAADDARSSHAYPEELGYLVRAEGLWPLIDVRSREGIEHVPLLEAAATAARRCMDFSAVRALTDRALQLLDRGARPLEASRVLLAWAAGRKSSTDSELGLATQQEAVELSSTQPDSEEHALALAQLAETHVWCGDLEEARRCAGVAVTVAERTSSEIAMAAALLARAFATMPEPQCVDDARRAYLLAVASGQPEWIEWATVTLANCHDALGALAPRLRCLLDGLAASREHGGTALTLVACAAESLLDLGDLRGAREMLRGVFGPRQGSWGGAMARLVAARICCRTGAADAAAQHLARAEELVDDLSGFVGLKAPVALAEYHLLVGEPQAAVDVVREGMQRHRADNSLDEMLMWGARAAADLADQARDRDDPAGTAAAVAALEELVEVRSGLPPAIVGRAYDTDERMRVEHSVFLAESARCRAEPSVQLWRAAAAASHASGLGYHEAMSQWRLATALLIEGVDRPEAAAALRTSRDYAAAQGVAPLTAEVEALANVARVSLEEPRELTPAAGSALDRLTPRERQVLSMLVAGHTYAEMADELFIGIKTVSTHVSHVLRKTGTANRVEAAALGRRLSPPRS